MTWKDIFEEIPVRTHIIFQVSSLCNYESSKYREDGPSNRMFAVVNRIQQTSCQNMLRSHHLILFISAYSAIVAK